MFWPLVFGLTQHSGKQSVPTRGSVGSPLLLAALSFTGTDQTLPRVGTDCFPLC